VKINDISNKEIAMDGRSSGDSFRLVVDALLGVW
jgi:hypothetical protein